MLGQKLNEYYRDIVDYITKKKYTFHSVLTWLPVNYILFQDEYKNLITLLNCTNIEKLPISTKETFLCETSNVNWYIKIPREDNFKTTIIREIIGSVFYSVFLDEKIYQYYYADEGKALISREIENFQPFSKYYQHLLFFNHSSQSYKETLVFNNTNCVDPNDLRKYKLSFFELLVGQDESWNTRFKYFCSHGIVNIIEGTFRILLQYNLKLTYVTSEDTSHIKFHNCFNKDEQWRFEGFEIAFMTSLLVHNADINFRNIGIRQDENHTKVVIIDYDRLGNHMFSGDTAANPNMEIFLYEKTERYIFQGAEASFHFLIFPNFSRQSVQKVLRCP